MGARHSLALGALGGAGLLMLILFWVGSPMAGAQPAGTPAAGTLTPAGAPSTVPDGRYFPETGHIVQGRFLEYWQQHGGLAQQGLPLTDEIQEKSDLNGQTYTVQYFERAIFEQHPEYGRPYDVLLSLLGVFLYQQRYGPAGAPGQHVSTDNPRFFPETQHTVGGKFRAYWESHGGLAQQGYPISEEFQEISPLNGQPYMVQYFQRAVFELHPENAGTPYEVLLSQLGTFRYRAHFGTLNIPLPPDRTAQVDPHGSAGYLVWDQVPTSGLGGAGNADVMGLNLVTGQPLLVAGGVGNQLHPAITGADVVWEDTNQSCPVCEADILGMNLTTGMTFTVASGPADQRFPAIAGAHAAWIESQNGVRRLLLGTLGNGPVTVVATDTLATQVQRPVLSYPLLVWSEVSPNAPRPSAGALHALDLQTGQPRTLAVLGDWTATYAVDGARVVWADDGIHFMDLTTGETALLAPQGRQPVIQGNTVVWTQQDPDGATHLWGVQLPGRRPLQLVADPGSQSGPALAGDWLVWENSDNAQAGRLGSISLARAFAAADVRPTATATPLPSPTISIYPSPPPTQPLPPTTPTAGPDLRLYVERVSGVPAMPRNANNFVFYLSAPDVGATPTPVGGANLALYGVALPQRETFLIRSAPAQMDHLVSDDTVLLWLEHPYNGPDQIRGYHLGTRSGFVLQTAPAAGVYLGLALDRGTVYYEDAGPIHHGIYARSLTGGTERLVAAEGMQPVAGSGVLLWSEAQSPGGHLQATLHMQRQGTQEDVVIASGPSGLRTYAVSGDDVVWAYVGTTPDEARVHHYRISTGTSDVLSPGPVQWVTIGGRTVVWSAVTGQIPGGGADLISVLAYNLDTGAIRPVMENIAGSVVAWAVAGDSVLVTFTPLGNGGPAELFVLGLPH